MKALIIILRLLLGIGAIGVHSAMRVIQIFRTVSRDVQKLPNKVTIARIVLCWIPGYCLMLNPDEISWVLSFFVAVNLFELIQRLGVIASFSFLASTDFVDGYLARKRGEVTKLGAFLDPLADKGLIIFSLIGLYFSSYYHYPEWFSVVLLLTVIVITVREISVTILRLYATVVDNLSIPADKLGKWKMGFQTGTVIALMMPVPFFIDGEILLWWYITVALIGCIVSIVLTIISGIDYFRNYMRVHEQANKKVRVKRFMPNRADV